MLGRNNYDYDDAGNRSTNQTGEVVTTGVFNELNQLLKESGGGKVQFRGTVDEPATVTAGGQKASVDAAGNFDGVTDVGVGNNTVPIVATDGSGNSRTNNYQVTVTAGANQALSYDADGNLAADGTKSYEWDAANRLLAINYTNTTNRTEFSYDGLGRRTKIVEKTGGAINSTKKFVWDGLTMAEERDGSNQVTRRYYPQGEQFVSYNPNTTTPCFYLRDHLGSVREMTDSSGGIQARYDYDLWGNRTKVSGSLDADFGFTGHYYHAPSTLHLAPYRAYSSGSGTWLSRDPIAEAGGINLYAYVKSNPVNYRDPLGLINWGQVGKGALGILGGVGSTAGAVGLTGTGFGVVAAPVLALSAAASFSYGIGNLIAGLADDPNKQYEANLTQNFPSNAGGIFGRAMGYFRGDADCGQRMQDLGSLGENVLSLGLGLRPPSGDLLNPAISLPYLSGVGSSSLSALNDWASLGNM